ncbi:VOC family protein [Actinophytocola sp. NPDC049390]|uniref:VOC family protein n=1 Tax=Actinophytocola sp. NPDC049390 TaxID=3363894 RepID=UPI0037B79F06
MAHGTVDWFQIDTDDTQGTEQFYGALFDWTFANDPDSPGYRVVTAKNANGPQGGVSAGTRNRATFFVVVSDVAATAAQAEELGGKVVDPPTTTPNGLTFAHLLDPAGNHVGIYSPPGQ